MDNDIYKDLVFQDGEWYISHETLMKKYPEYEYKIAKSIALSVASGGPTILGTPYFLLGQWYKVKNPEEFVKALTKE